MLQSSMSQIPGELFHLGKPCLNSSAIICEQPSVPLSKEEIFRETMTTNSDTTLLVQSAERPDQNCVHLANSSINVAPPPLHQPSRTSVEGPVAILWDIENCPVPSDVRPEDVAGNIRMALRVHPAINGAAAQRRLPENRRETHRRA
ncbi:hypothetical protein Ancab_029896 [Ancistrocladus abbreviatus]